MRKITEGIIHCSASGFGDAFLINQWHLERGFSSCGYHFVILNGHLGDDQYIPMLDGHVCPWRPISKIGAHCKGHNRNSIGICLIGDMKFTPRQYESLRFLCFFLENKFPFIRFNPHNKYNSNKTCPNFLVEYILRGWHKKSPRP